MTQENNFEEAYEAPFSDIEGDSIDFIGIKHNVLTIYLGFKGRISRRVYWVYYIFPVVFTYILRLAYFQYQVNGLLDKSDRSDSAMRDLFIENADSIIFHTFIVSFITLFVSAKRYHDKNRSGWWSLLFFIPYLGWLVLLIELGFMKGDKGENRFGNPCHNLMS